MRLVFVFGGVGKNYNSTVPLKRRSGTKSSLSVKWKTQVSSEPPLGSELRRTGTIQQQGAGAVVRSNHQSQGPFFRTDARRAVSLPAVTHITLMLLYTIPIEVLWSPDPRSSLGFILDATASERNLLYLRASEFSHNPCHSKQVSLFFCLYSNCSVLILISPSFFSLA